MNPASPAPTGGRDTPAARQQTETRPGETPNADMQAEDTGSEDSATDSGTAATRAMKQTSKTAAESGGKR